MPSLLHYLAPYSNIMICRCLSSGEPCGLEIRFMFMLVVGTSPSVPTSWPITAFITRVTWRVSLVEQSPENQCLPLVFDGVCGARSLVFCVVLSGLHHLVPTTFTYDDKTGRIWVLTWSSRPWKFSGGNMPCINF